MSARHAALALILVIGAAGRARGQDFQIIHGFGPAITSLSIPTSLMQASDGYLYGTAFFSGNDHLGPGAVFRITPQGAMHPTVWFVRGSGVVEARDGTLYVVGQSTLPQTHGVFRLGTSSSPEVVRSFDFEVDGDPRAPVVQGADGHLYGTTYEGGASQHGAIFRLTTAGSITWLHAFDGTDGSHPSAALIQASDGHFYGTTPEGGASGLGTVFRMTAAGAVTVLHDFSGADGDGATPQGALVQGIDGDFYGTTSEGGEHGHGTFFRLKADGALTVVHAFTGGDDGGGPSNLIRTSDGRFCGGTQGLTPGRIYCVTPGGVFSVLHTLDTSTEGYNSPALVHGFDGSFYGVATSAFFGGGTVFRQRNPAPCDSAVALLYRGGVLDIRVTLRSALPAFTGAWLVHGSIVSPLWSTLIPAITPALLVHVPIWPLPAIGPVGVYTLVVTSSNDVCVDWKTIQTGGS